MRSRVRGPSKQLGELKLRSWWKSRRAPETNGLYVLTVTDDEIQSRRPDGTVESIPISDVQRICVETNDTGPVGVDVWWVIEGLERHLRFPSESLGKNPF